VATAGLGLRWSVPVGRVALAIAGSASGAYVSLAGAPSSSSFYGATYGGLTVEGRAAFEVAVTLRSLRLGGAVEGGALAPGPIGRVDGDESVHVDGPWVGASLFAGLLL
jgi:hypothetical protein